MLRKSDAAENGVKMVKLFAGVLGQFLYLIVPRQGEGENLESYTVLFNQLECLRPLGLCAPPPKRAIVSLVGFSWWGFEPMDLWFTATQVAFSELSTA